MLFPLPDELKVALAQAYRAVAEDPQHDLCLGIRQVIWRELGPRPDPDLHPLSPGLCRRAHLARISAERVLFIWEAARPGDCLLSRYLGLCWGYLRGEAGRSSLESAIRHCSEVFESQEYVRELEVVNAVCRALIWAVSDAPFDAERIDLALTDAQVGPYELAPAFFAAYLVAGGGAWDEGSDTSRRREFWEWWLDTAVPIAWISVGDAAG